MRPIVPEEQTGRDDPGCAAVAVHERVSVAEERFRRHLTRAAAAFGRWREPGLSNEFELEKTAKGTVGLPGNDESLVENPRDLIAWAVKYNEALLLPRGRVNDTVLCSNAGRNAAPKFDLGLH